MAKRWLGLIQPATGTGRSLPGIYADHLRDLHRKCVSESDFSVDVLSYSTIVSNQNMVPARDGFSNGHRLSHERQERQRTEVDRNRNDGTQRPLQHFDASDSRQSGLNRPSPVISQTCNNLTSPSRAENDTGPTSLQGESTLLSPGPNPLENGVADSITSMDYSTSQGGALNDELSAISYTLLDQSFMDMDRVISFDDMLFSMSMTPTIGTGIPASMS